MRAVFFLGLFILAGCLRATAQTALLPTVILDSMIFEVKRGRQCELVTKAQASELEAMGKELAHTNVALKLSEEKSSTLSSLLGNARESNQIEMKQHLLDKHKLKSKIRKRNILVIGQTVLIVILIL